MFQSFLKIYNFLGLLFLIPKVYNKLIHNNSSSNFGLNGFFLGTVKFSINILKESGIFELLEGGSLAFSGSIKLLTEKLAKSKIKHMTMISEEMDLNSDDFYKELRLRGYQYKDAFLGFVEANGEGNK